MYTNELKELRPGDRVILKDKEDLEWLEAMGMLPVPDRFYGRTVTVLSVDVYKETVEVYFDSLYKGIISFIAIDKIDSPSNYFCRHDYLKTPKPVLKGNWLDCKLCGHQDEES